MAARLVHLLVVARWCGGRGKVFRDVEACRRSILAHLEAAGNVADDEWATLVCADRYLPFAAPSAPPSGPSPLVFEDLICASPKAPPPEALRDLTLGKFFFYAATHPKRGAGAIHRRFNFRRHGRKRSGERLYLSRPLREMIAR